MISEVYNGDCMDYMAKFEDNFFDLAIVDPPYGINAPKMQMGSNPNRKGPNQYPGISTAVKLRKGRLNQGGGKLKNRILNNSDCSWDNNPPTEEYFKELFRISKYQIIWGGNYFDLGISRCWIVWDKVQPWENFSQFEMAWTNFDKPAIMIRVSNTGGANNEIKIHETQKPVRLYEETFRRLSWPKIKVIDTHMGSQSSRIASYKLGFDYFGSEIDKKKFEDGCNRFEKFRTEYDIQEKLFDLLPNFEQQEFDL